MESLLWLINQTAKIKWVEIGDENLQQKRINEFLLTLYKNAVYNLWHITTGCLNLILVNTFPSPKLFSCFNFFFFSAKSHTSAGVSTTQSYLVLKYLSFFTFFGLSYLHSTTPLQVLFHRIVENSKNYPFRKFRRVPITWSPTTFERTDANLF